MYNFSDMGILNIQVNREGILTKINQYASQVDKGCKLHNNSMTISNTLALYISMR